MTEWLTSTSLPTYRLFLQKVFNFSQVKFTFLKWCYKGPTDFPVSIISLMSLRSIFVDFCSSSDRSLKETPLTVSKYGLPLHPALPQKHTLFIYVQICQILALKANHISEAPISSEERMRRGGEINRLMNLRGKQQTWE